ncbi:MAG: sugar phosphate isomerase/epimerase [Verrucomicrobia bacterium]|nr:sugar phosphate isomerase/epimerase [Verrucomicrobiota bacterium]
MQLNRRTFIRTLAVAGVAGGAGMTRAQQVAPKILLGICAGPDQAGKLKALGFDFIEGGVDGMLKPSVPDAGFAPLLATLKASELPIRSCNGYLPKEFRLTGPATRHAAALEYAVTACHRADALGIPYLVLGSGGARNVPAGFAIDKGKAQFIGFCQQLGDRIKDCQVTIVLEPLNKGESNILNSVAEGIAYVDAIRSPRIQLLADFYHMMKEGEGPASIRMAAARLRHCHLAELEGRQAPGTKGEDMRGFFKALRDIGYAGGVSCECGWPKENLEAAWKKALATMREQAMNF